MSKWVSSKMFEDDSSTCGIGPIRVKRFEKPFIVHSSRKLRMHLTRGPEINGSYPGLNIERKGYQSVFGSIFTLILFE